MFQHTAARRRLEFQTAYQTKRSKFQHTAARRRLVENQSNTQPMKVFQHTAARRRLARSTGSSAKIGGFNTQPPEGGWLIPELDIIYQRLFQHTAARRRLVALHQSPLRMDWFQHTAARRRLASFRLSLLNNHKVSTHSRPKAAGRTGEIDVFQPWFQHTAARRRLDESSVILSVS